MGVKFDLKSVRWDVRNFFVLWNGMVSVNEFETVRLIDFEFVGQGVDLRDGKLYVWSNECLSRSPKLSDWHHQNVSINLFDRE